MSEPRIQGGVGTASHHDSARKHVTGAARYTDDLVEPPSLLHGCFGLSEVAHGRILALNLDDVRAAPGVAAVLTAQDVPGVNDVSPLGMDDPLFADGIVEYVGQPIFLVVAETRRMARCAARRVSIEYETRPALLTARAALAGDSHVLPPYRVTRGDAGAAIEASPHRIRGEFEMGGQDHLYLEGHIALCTPDEDNDLHIFSSSQHPSEIQHKVAALLGLAHNEVTVEVRRVGGGFGGKESQPTLFAAGAALASRSTKRPVKIRPDRDDDMAMTGKRHDFVVRYRAGFDSSGTILGVELQLYARCGRSQDLSGPINDRSVFHVDNAYYLPNVEIESLRLKTHTVSNTAFRGFGGPQGMLAIERVIEHIARELRLDPLRVRRTNLYAAPPRDSTHYGMKFEQNHLPDLISTLSESAAYEFRRHRIGEFNRESRVLKKGISLTPVKFGISFTNTALNQAGALLNVYTDGSVSINHGGTEMGQGLFVKVAQVVAQVLQIDLARIKPTATRTDKVPNTSATAASSGSDLNGAAAGIAARKIKDRLTEFAAEHFGIGRDRVRFAANRVFAGENELSFTELVRLAYLARIALSATGYYRTPKIGYDRGTGRGRPFYYFSQGAAVSEVLLDSLTGEHRVTRVDILHDVGNSLNPAMDLGQIEGGFVQGMGWLTSEELVWDPSGRLLTHAPSTYKIPTARDRPTEFYVRLFQGHPNSEETVFRSKAVGEPPLMLAISVFFALNDAIAACSDDRVMPELDAPATPERVLKAIARLRS